MSPSRQTEIELRLQPEIGLRCGDDASLGVPRRRQSADSCLQCSGGAVYDEGDYYDAVVAVADSWRPQQPKQLVS
jgi:hypothetical protein